MSANAGAYEAAEIDIVLSSGEVTTVGPGMDGPLPPGLREGHVMAAWNPGGVPVSRQANDAAHRRLLEKVGWPSDDLGIAIGRDPETPHFEVGVVVFGRSDSEALVLGRGFDQEAIFALRRDKVEVLWCTGGGPAPPQSSDRRRSSASVSSP